MKVQSKPEVCSPLPVVGNPKVKLCLALNLRHLNQFLHVQSYKYEDLHIAALMFEQGEYLFKFDGDLHGIENYYVYAMRFCWGFAWHRELLCL